MQTDDQGKYSFATVYPSPQFLSNAGYDKVSNIPAIFDSRPGYHRFGSRFLIDRGLGLWDQSGRGAQRLPIPPSTRSMQNYAERLCNFLEWCDVRGYEPMTLEYSQDLIGKYQANMLSGAWSRDNRPLAEATINVRVEIAAEYLTWAADKGLRTLFVVPKVTRTFVPSNPRNSYGSEPKAIDARKGKLRVSKRLSGFPLDEDIALWHARLNNKLIRGPTEALIAELIMETAIRREEAACWRLDTLPLDSDEWNVLNPHAAYEKQAILLEIKFGTKGVEYGRNHGDKIGPLGTIRVPLSLVEKLHVYREKQRPQALDVSVREGRTVSEQRRIQDETVHLFLNPLTGKRYTGNNIYESWRSVERPKCWSPHMARHYWACTLLWRRLEDQRKLLESAIKSNVDALVIQSFQSTALSIIELEIQPQLRHVSRETTKIYLQWVFDQLGVNLNLQERWVEVLRDADDDMKS